MGGKNANISGIALIKAKKYRSFFLVVHDNKKKNQGRLAILRTVKEKPPLYFPLHWPKEIDLPIDLEAVTRADEGSFMLMTSAGKIYHVKLNAPKRSISILKIFNLPLIPTKSNFEGFDIYKANGKTLAVWGHRGKNDSPGIIYWGELNLVDYSFSKVNSAEIKVPWPKKKNVRHISDLKIDSAGTVFISSVSDPGDDGPFCSAIYAAGTFVSQKGRVVFQKNTIWTRLYTFKYNKVEAMELVSGKMGGIVFATDDENKGSSVYVTW